MLFQKFSLATLQVNRHHSASWTSAANARFTTVQRTKTSRGRANHYLEPTKCSIDKSLWTRVACSARRCQLRRRSYRATVCSSRTTGTEVTIKQRTKSLEAPFRSSKMRPTGQIRAGAGESRVLLRRTLPDKRIQQRTSLPWKIDKRY